MESEHIKSLSLEASFAKYRSIKELDTAVNDLTSYNYFSVIEIAENGEGGPYDVKLDLSDNRLILNIRSTHKSKKLVKVSVPMRSFRSLIKDYFLICESYQAMLIDGQIEKVEAIDMGRRGLHNEGAELLLHLLENKINTDFETARRLFTIITVLHMT